MTACISFIQGSVNFIFPESFFKFYLLLFIKIKNVLLFVLVATLVMIYVSKTPSFYRVALK